MQSKKPQIKKIEKKLSIHNDVRIDNYYWLNKRDNKEVIEHLNAENSYSKEVLKNTNDLKDNLFEEMKSRIKEDEIIGILKNFKKEKSTPYTPENSKSFLTKKN